MILGLALHFGGATNALGYCSGTRTYGTVVTRSGMCVVRCDAWIRY